MTGRVTRSKRIKLDKDYVADYDDVSISSHNDIEDSDEARKSRIRDSNREFARRMTILQTWSEYWTDFSTREGEAYPQQEARDIIKRSKKISCPISTCGKTYTTIGGLKYHYARCNIERSFKCKVCDPSTQCSTRGELLKHLILNHYHELPSLNDDQRDIANSYLSCKPRVESNRREKRLGADCEYPSDVRTLIRGYLDLVNNVKESRESGQQPFANWESRGSDWELLTFEMERRRYYPTESQSPSIKFSSDSEWQSLKTGEAKLLGHDKRGFPANHIFYTGGHITSVSWLPKYHFGKNYQSAETIAISVNCCSLDDVQTYKDSSEGENCIQFWTLDGCQDLKKNDALNCTLSYMIGHKYGTVFDMAWCPLGASWTAPSENLNDENELSRAGLLAIACGDGQIRIINVPHYQILLDKALKRTTGSKIEMTPIFRTRPIATLAAPNIGSITDNNTIACKAISWAPDNDQRLIVAGYANGIVALFDLSNKSPILYAHVDGCHEYHAVQSWVAHGGPVTGVAIAAGPLDRTLVATGSFDRQLKIWNPSDLNSCLTADRPPITKVAWDFRFRGILTANDVAFTSFHNRVSYRFPTSDGNYNLTISNHRSSVWGLTVSPVTSAVATSDAAGEVFVMPQLITRTFHKRERTFLSTHSLYTMVPQALSQTKSVMGEIVAQSNSNSDGNNNSNNNSSSNNNNNDDDDNYNTITNNSDNVNNNSNPNGSSSPQPISGLDKGDADENFIEIDAEYNTVERPIANKPNKFVLPLECRPVETYRDYKSKFGIQYKHYSSAISHDSKQPESCIRASDIKDIYCDRACDYPFTSINHVTWSPNTNTFPYLLSASHIGVCRIDRVQIVEQIYHGYIDPLLNRDHDSLLVKEGKPEQ